MSNVKRLVTSAAAILLVVSTVCAQEQTPASSTRSTTTVTAAATADRVRFTAPSTTVQMRLEVYAANGLKLFDNEIRGGNVIDWLLQDGKAERLSEGSYLCVVTGKSVSGRMSQKLGKIVIENAAASVGPIDTTQLTAQQSQAVGALEENASLTVLKEGETQTATVIAHNGDEGQITRGRGALSFRIGDFYSGKDTEQMRLTAEGNLGIGITHPQVRLDVDGVIRASQGIIFPDGSTQYSAASKTLGAKSTLADQASDQFLGGKHKFQTQSVTQNHIVKFTDGGGTLGDSVITETGGGLLGIGTSGPDSLLNIQGAIPSLLGHMSVIRTTGSNNGFGLLMDATGSGNNNLGLAVMGAPKASFAWDNSRQFLGFVNFNYSANDFALRINSDGSLTYHDGASSAERFRITAGGNVGIGTTNPMARLHVAGGDLLFENKWRTETTTVNPGPVPGPPNLIGGFLGTGSGGATPGNRVTAGVVGATIGGGGFKGSITFPSGGSSSGDASNRVTDWFGTVGGGWANRAGSDDATLDNAAFATVGGGFGNIASGGATVGGGFSNYASGFGATVGGGIDNTASGDAATVPGGRGNAAFGNHSFAAGNLAKANHQSTFVWADSTLADFVSTGANQFLIRASGGVGIGTNSPSSLLHVFRGSSGGTADSNAIATLEKDTNGYLQLLTPNANESGVLFGNVASSAAGGVVYNNLDTPNGLQFRTNGNQTRMVIDSIGNVGIGTTAPKSKLHIAGGNIFIAQPNSLIITSPNGECWFITVDNSGALSTISVTCPN